MMPFSDMAISFAIGAVASHLVGRLLELKAQLKKTVDYIDQYQRYLDSVKEVLAVFEDNKGTELEFNRLKHLLYNVNTLEWSQRFIDAEITDTTSHGVSVIVRLQEDLYGMSSFEDAGFARNEIVIVKSDLLKAIHKLITLRDERKNELAPIKHMFR